MLTNKYEVCIIYKVSAYLIGFYCGCSSMVEHQPSKLIVRVRFPSPAPNFIFTAIYFIMILILKNTVPEGILFFSL